MRDSECSRRWTTTCCCWVTGLKVSQSAPVIDSQGLKSSELRPGAAQALRRILPRSRTARRWMVPCPCWPPRSGFIFGEHASADIRLCRRMHRHRERIAVEIVQKHPGQVGFTVHPRRCMVERFFAWIGYNGRLARDFRSDPRSAEALLYTASVMLLLRTLGRAG